MKYIYTLILFLSIQSTASEFTDEKYIGMKRDFLNTNSNVHIVDFTSLNQSEYTDLVSKLGYGSYNKYGISLRQQGPDSYYANEWQFYGVGGPCVNKDGQKSLCWKATGGTRGGIYNEDKNGHCGIVIPSDKKIDDNLDSLVCKEENVGWSGFNFWLGAGNNYNYLQDHFPNTKNKPLNRLCIEMEWPEEKLSIKNNYLTRQPAATQVVNPGNIHPNLAKLTFEVGTYTAPRTNIQGETKDDEIGSTYQGGGSHYYHKGPNHAYYSTDKIYALNSNTTVYCASDMPTGVRVAMAPTYVNNPLQGVNGANNDGISLTPNYWNYVTRAYFRFRVEGSTANYPQNFKINRMWMMYEPNDIILLTESYNDVSSMFTFKNSAATHKIHIHNHTNENSDPNGYRDYRLFVAEGQQTPEPQKARWMKVFLDNDKAGTLGKLDDNDSEIKPMEIIRLKNGKSRMLLIQHSPDFNHSYSGTFSRNGRRVSQVKLALQEVNRLRSSSITIRTWEKLKHDPDNQVYREKWVKNSYFRNREGLALKITPALGAGLRNIKLALNKSGENVRIFSFEPTENSVDAIAKSLNNKINSMDDMKGKVSVEVKDNTVFIKAFEPTIYDVNGFELVAVGDEKNKWYQYKKYNRETLDTKMYFMKNTADYIKINNDRPLSPSSIKVFNNP